MRVGACVRACSSLLFANFVTTCKESSTRKVIDIYLSPRVHDSCVLLAVCRLLLAASGDHLAPFALHTPFKRHASSCANIDLILCQVLL